MAAQGRGTLQGAVALGAVVACGWLVAPGSAAAAPGDLDTTFGAPNGFVALDISPKASSTLIQDLLVEPGTGKIVAAMWIPGPGGQGLCSFAVARFLPSGSLDPTFNPNPGQGVQGISDTALTATGCLGGDVPSSVARTSDGKYVVAGASGDRILLARFTTDGDLDASFDGDPDPTATDGQVVTTVPGIDVINRLAGVDVRPDGVITVAATAEVPIPGPSTENTIVVARYLANGALDPAFDESPAAAPAGIVFVNDPAHEETGNGMLVDPAGRTVIAGSVIPAGGLSQVFVARLTATGARDNAFSGDGISAFGLGAPLAPDQASDVVRQPGGRLVLAAQVDPLFTPSYAVAGVTDSGQLDAGFGAGGATVAPVGELGEIVLGSKIASQPDGKLVVAGNRLIPPGPAFRAVLARFRADGTLDTTYGTQGVAQPATFATPDPQISGLDIGANGHAVVGGSVQTTPVRALLARFQGGEPASGGPPVVPDTTAPETTISKKPKKKSSKKKVKVEFASSEPGSTFTCQLNKKPAVACTSPFTAKSKKGKNKLLVTATDAAGNADATPAVAKWKYVPKG